MSWIMESNQGVLINVRVTPRASKEELHGLYGDSVKIRLQAPPVKGKANDALVRFLSRTLEVPARQIHIISGASARRKRVLIEGLSVTEVQSRCGL